MIDLDDIEGVVSGEKTVRFVSDLHLGHPGAALKTSSDFEFLIKGCGVLVVCGDFHEARQSPYYDEAVKLRSIFEGVCHHEGVELIILSGNHDPNEQYSIATMHSGSIVAMHGHELFKEVAPWGREYLFNRELADKTIAKYPDAGTNLKSCLSLAREMSTFVPPVIKREAKSRNMLIKLLYFIKNGCWPPIRPLNVIRAWLSMHRRMENFLDRFFPNAKLVCYGHLHRRDIYLKKGRLFVNTGALFKQTPAYAVDITDEHIVIRKVSAKGWGKVAAKYRLEDHK